MAWSALGQGLPATQTGTITINDAAFELGRHIPAKATPYPSVITQSNLLGQLQKITVTLNGLNHSYASDVDVLLVRTNDGKRVVLLSDVGLGGAFNNATITLDSDATATLPTSGSISSGTYKPRDVDAGGEFEDDASEFPDAVGTTTGDNLKEFFAGTSPNGVWRLYVVDDKFNDVGTISSWSVNLFTTPVFTKVPTTTITNNEDAEFSFQVEIDDSDTPADQLRLSVVSADQTIVTNTAFTVEGTGKVRTVRFTPLPNRNTGDGVLALTLRLEDNINKDGSAITETVNIRIVPVNDAPTLTLSTDAVTTLSGVLTTNLNLYAVVRDVDNDVNSLRLTARSSDPAVVNPTNVFFVRGENGTNYISIAPTGGASGMAEVQIAVDDGSLTNTAPVTVTVNRPAWAVFGNPAAINIPASGASSPYPSSVVVSNIPGLIGRITVTLADLDHPNPQDLDILLQGPTTNVVLMAGAGGSDEVVHGRITFDDNAADPIPEDGPIAPVPDNGPVRTYTYQPAAYRTPAFGSGAPTEFGSALSAFRSTNPNGTWSLWVTNRATGAAGRIEGGFVLNIFPAPTITGLPETVTTDEDTAVTINFTVGDYDGSVTNVTIEPTVSGFVNSSVSLNGNQVSVTLTPQSNVFGTNNIRVIARDNNPPSGFTVTNTFSLRVRSVNDTPLFDSPIPTQITYAGIPIQGIPFSVRDGADNETPAGAIQVTGRSSDSRILPDSNIVLNNLGGGNWTVSLFPITTQAGQATVTLTARDADGATRETSFLLNVLTAASPLFANSGSILIQDPSGADPAIAQPYPSSITVSGLEGQIVAVEVSLLGLNHPNPQDLDILLVGPSPANKRVLLMSDVGGNTDVSNAQIIFGSVSNPPLSEPIGSGIFRPTADGTTDVFPAPGPGSVSGVSLDLNATFAGDSPNGTWQLYIVDDTQNDRGATIANGWSIRFITTPVLAAIPDQTTQEDTPARVSIDLGDDQPGLATTVVATSSNTSLVPNGNITVEGTGASRTLTITPAANQSGTTTITVTATVAGVSVSRSFQLTVQAVDDPPTISEVPTQNSPAGRIIGPITVTVADPDNPGANIQLTATSSNEEVVPNANIRIEPGNGPAGDRLITILPNANRTGTATITLTATTAGSGLANPKATRSFAVNYLRNLSFANTSPIEIRDDSTGNPYPSIIPVSGLNGAVSGVSVTILGFRHSFPDDAAILLVSPDDSRKVVLMANAGGGAPTNSVSGLTFTFDDAGQTLGSEERLNNRTYAPANYGVGTPNGNFPAPAPTAPYSTSLSSFAAVNPNGNWKLYVLDDTFGEAGAIEGGWVLILNTAPTVLPIPAQQTLEDVPLLVPLFLSDEDSDGTDLRTWAISSDDVLVPNNTATSTNLSIQPTNTLSRVLQVTPAPNRSGTNTITVFVADATRTNSTSFHLTVSPVDDPPVITTATNFVRILEDQSTNIVFRVSDVDSVLSVTNAGAVSASATLVPATNIVVTGPTSIPAGTTGDINVAITPGANQFGTNTITFSIRDGTTTVTREITLAVDPVNDRPTITGLPASTNVVAGGTLREIPFTVRDVETPARQLTITATSSDQSRLPNANISVGGADENRLLSLTTIGAGAGSVVVTIVVSDGVEETTATMNVTISPPPDTHLFANTAQITIRDNDIAQPYPSTINIPAGSLVGSIHRIQVTLDGFSHTAPDDVDVLLVAPTGQKIILLSDAGGAIPVSNARLVFDANASALPPDAGPLTSGTYRPFNYGGLDTFPGVAAPYDHGLEDLIGRSPIGDWSLYVLDDTAGQSGSIAQGWSISITTAPSLELDGASLLTQAEDTEITTTIRVRDPDSATTVENIQLSATSSNPTLIPPGNVTFSLISGTPATTAFYQVRILPGTNQPADNLQATNLLTITARRTTDGAQTSVVLTNVVIPVNDLPQISRITPKSTGENQPVSFVFLVSDVDTPRSEITLEAFSSDTSLISHTNLLLFDLTNRIVGLPSSEVRFTVVPNQGATGSGSITVTATESTTNSVSVTFPITVTEFDDPPSISEIADISVPAGQSTTNIAFTVTDPDSANITLTATSSDQSLVRDANIVLSATSGPPGARTVRVTAEVGVTGSAIITIRASDGVNTDEETFVVNVIESRERTSSNPNRIVITDNSSGNPYPSTIVVDNLIGVIDRIRVTITGFAHSFPSDADILLVGPEGQKVLLLSDVGAGNSVTNINLTFDETAERALPQNDRIESGTWKPSNYDGASDPFPSPAPAGPYATSLNEFVGKRANGEWRLFVVDDTAQDGGFINGGWSLNITTRPSIQGLSNITINEDETFRIPFTILEEAFADESFTFRATSTNEALIAAADLTFSGSGTNWNVSGTPKLNASGETDIRIFAKNAFNQEVSGVVHVTVNPVNDAPVITEIPDQVIFAGTTTSELQFSYSDAETEARNLTLSVASSDTRLIPTENVFILGNQMTIAPVGNLTGESEITLTVTDGDGLSASTSFKVTVLPALNPQFANAEPITIRDNNTAAPYPSTIEVSGVAGPAARVTVTLAQVNHVYPADIDILLVGPNGQKTLLMSDAGGAGQLQNARLAFDDRASNNIPQNPSQPVPSGTYKPTNYQGADNFPSPAPAGPYAVELSVFNGTDPNGTWSLYVVDDASPDGGSIAGGWILNIFTTQPTISVIPDQVTEENVPLTVEFRVEDADTPAASLITAATSDNTGLLTLAIQGTGNQRTLTITPRQDASGTARVTVSVTDGTSIAQTSFNVTVETVNQAPVISGLPAELATSSSRVLTQTFTVADRETEAEDLEVGATILNASLGSVAVSGESTERTLTFTPSGAQGQTFITVVASDGEKSTTNTVAITVTAPCELTFGAIQSPQTGLQDQVLLVPFTIDSSEPGGSLVVTATADDTNVISRVEITGGGTEFTARVIPALGASGTNITVTINAANDCGSGSTSFVVNIMPVQPPSIAPIPDQTTTVNVAKIVTLEVSDPDTPLNSLQFNWSTSNSNLVRNVAFGIVGGTSVRATVNLVRDATGVANVTIFVSDGVSTVGQSFRLTVGEPGGTGPDLAPIADQTVPVGQPVVIQLTVTDPDTPLNNLTFSSTTTNPGLVSGVTVDTAGGSAVATIDLVPGATGVATVTITVSDGVSSDSESFALQVISGDEPVVNPPTVSTVNGVTTITVTWTGGGELETATSLTGPWTATGNSSGTYSEAATGAAKFYRVRRN